jgi:hypothetical protein
MSACEAPANWRKSSFSQNGDCIEVAYTEGHICVRDSKSRSGDVLKFGYAEWKLFITEVESGEFNLDSGTST